MEESKIKKVNIKISSEILKSSNLNPEELTKHFEFLSSVFKKRFLEIVPSNIKGLPDLNFIVDLSKNLQEIKNCDGFDKHVANYNKEQVHSNYLITLIASCLVSKVDKLKLEPVIGPSGKTSDIYVELSGEEVYIEGKRINIDYIAYLKEHERMFNKLSRYFKKFPYQITITYNKTLSDKELEELGKTLLKKLPFVTAEGKIINNENLEVHVNPKVASPNKKVVVILSGLMVDTVTNRKYPMDIFLKEGYNMGLNGPLVNFSRILQDKIKKGRKQFCPEKPFILVIDSNMMLGDLDKNMKYLSNVFQSQINTRFSGILLVEHGDDLKKRYIQFKFVSNPYAKYPVSKKFELLFKNDD